MAQPAALPDKWWHAQDDVAIVTGANKGIGFEIARLLAEAGWRVVATARDPALGAAALAKLRASPGLPDPSRVTLARLDITSGESIQAFRDNVAAAHPGGVTALINNAGFAYKGSVFGADEAQYTLNTNFRGTANVCEALAPLLRDGRGRAVNVSSGSGALRNIPGPALRAELAQPQDRPQLEALAGAFVASIRAGRNEEEGWGSSMYGVSKALETAYTRVLAQQLAPRGIAANACCPGWCATDMSSHRGPRSAAQGADVAVWLACLPPPAGGGGGGGELLTGGFWRDRERQPF